MGRRLAFHPLLIAAFPVLFLWTQNLDEVRFGEVIEPLMLTVGVTVAMFAVATLAFRDHRRGALVSSGLAFLTLSYGHIWGVVNRVIAEHWILLSVWLLLAVGVIAAAMVVRERLPDLTRGMNLAAVLVLLVTLLPVPLHLSVDTGRSARAATAADPDVGAARAVPPGRDIFYIVLDRYPRADTLEHLYGYDNGPFITFLEGRGFEVADASVANYPKTAHSLAASLDMRYLDDIAERQRDPGLFELDSSWHPIQEILREHRVGRFLKGEGYRYIHLGTWWQGTAGSPLADRNLRYGTASEFGLALLDTTPIPAVAAVLNREGDLDTRSFKRNSTLYQFDALERLAAQDPVEPRFVFAHLTIPHEPYVFDAAGREVTREEEAQRSRAENLVGQLRYANRRVTSLIDRLLEGPDEEDPIIVLQSDEGPNPERLLLEEDGFVWTEATDAELLEKFRILNAYHLPGLDRSPVYEHITPVNSFRLIFGTYFGADLDLLEDRAYVFHDERHLYDFTEVTDRVRGGGPLTDQVTP